MLLRYFDFLREEIIILSLEVKLIVCYGVGIYLEEKFCFVWYFGC